MRVREPIGRGSLLAGATLALILVLGRAAMVQPTVGAPPPGSEHEGPAFSFSEVRPGIYHAVGTGTLTVGCNAVDRAYGLLNGTEQ